MGTREIRLTKGMVALVDEEDYEWLSEWKWHYAGDYAVRSRPLWKHSSGPKHLTMHREIMDAPEGVLVDHRNHDKLDNRRANLRLATSKENSRNQSLQRTNKSGYKGVCWDSLREKWKAYIHVNDKIINIGRYDNVVEAARAYDLAADRLHGAYAYTNVMLGKLPPLPQDAFQNPREHADDANNTASVSESVSEPELVLVESRLVEVETFIDFVDPSWATVAAEPMDVGLKDGDTFAGVTGIVVEVAAQ